MKKLLIIASACIISSVSFAAIPAATAKLMAINPNLVERISPVGKSCMQSKPCSEAAAAPVATAGSSSGAVDGGSVFSSVCAACHTSGMMGAPKLGNKADWAPRIAQGKDLLYTHALTGFTGKNGMMPAKGGSASLSDAQVKAAVDYMVSNAK